MTLRTDLLRIASELPKGDPTRREILAALHERGAARGDVPDLRTATKMVRKWMDHAREPEKELIAFTEAMEGAGHDELVELLDEAINKFSQARGALDYVRIRLDKYLS